MSNDRPEIMRLRTFIPPGTAGLSVRKNPKNGFCVISLHMSADPKKQSEEYRNSIKAQMPLEDFKREYDLERTVYAGEAVYGSEFNRRVHVATTNIYPEPSLPLIRGWDSGGRPACVLCQVSGRRLTILAGLPSTEFVPSSIFVPNAIQWAENLYPGHSYIDIVDPACFDEGKTIEGRVWVDTLVEAGLAPIPGQRLFEDRRNAVLQLMRTMEAGKPLLVINPNESGCEFIIRGFEGGYQYPERVSVRSNVRADRPLKNGFSHIHDAIQYVATMVQHMPSLSRRSKSATMSSGPAYGFIRGRR